MAIKLLVLACLMAVAHAGVIAPVAIFTNEEEHSSAKYSYEYPVHDEHPKDIKNQHEIHHGDQMQDSYSLIKDDDTRRTMEYTADDHTGFNVVVHRDPTQNAVSHRKELKVTTPVNHHVHAIPVVQYSTPVLYAQAAPAAPIHHHSNEGPIDHYAHYTIASSPSVPTTAHSYYLQ